MPDRDRVWGILSIVAGMLPVVCILALVVYWMIQGLGHNEAEHIQELIQ